MKSRILALLALILPALVACEKAQEKELVSFLKDKVFYAETPSGDATKTYLNGELQVLWNADDLLSVFRSTTNERYRFDGEDGETRNAFYKDDESVPGEAFPRNYAVYPYLPGTSCTEEGILSVSLPATQFYAAGSFGRDANTMVAATYNYADNYFYFKNVGSYLRLQLYGGDRIRSIKFYGNSGEKIAGKASISVDTYKVPVVKMSEEASAEITLDCGEAGVATPEEVSDAIPFWIVLPATNFSSGFTVEITNTSGSKLIKSTTHPQAFAQNTVKTMSALKFDMKDVKEILSFSLSDGVHSYDAFNIGDNIIDVQVPNGTDLSAMTACFTYNGAGVMLDDAEQISGEGQHNFSDFINPLQYKVKAINGSSKTYTIRIFDLPIIQIKTPSPITSKEIWVADCSVTIRNDNIVTDYGQKVQIKGRGNSTWNRSPKKPYTMKMSSKASVLGMPPDKRWNLLANFFDRTIIRNAVSFEIAKKADALKWVPRGQFVELILNGEFVGTYYLCEHIKIAPDRVNITEMSKGDTTGDAITGGYLLEYDKRDDTDPFFNSAICNYRINIKSPEDDGFDVQWAWINSYINNLEGVLTNDESFASRVYLDYMDIDSYIDWWLVYELTGNGHEPMAPYSSYMYKDRGGKINAGPVWDFDLYTFIPNTTGFVLNKALYYKYLFGDSFFVARVKERWSMFKQNLEGIPDYFDEQRLLVLNAAMRNGEMWPITEDINKDISLSVSDAMSRIKSAYSERLLEMDSLISNLSVNYDDKSGGNEDFDGQQDKGGDFNFGF